MMLYSRLFALCVATALFISYLPNSYSQVIFNPEGYYLFDYYLTSPPEPPAVVRDATVTTVVTQVGTNRIATSFRQINKMSNTSSFSGSLFQPKTTAGSLFDSVSLSLDGSQANVDDDTLGGSGKDRDAGFLLTAAVGDNLSFGLGYSHNWYTIGGRDNLAGEFTTKRSNYKQQSDAIDVFLNYLLGDSWAVGVFVNQSWIDIEEVWRFNINTLLSENIGDSFSRWGAGLMLSYNIPITNSLNVGFTNTVSSMNKSSIGRVFDDEDSAWLCMIDCDQAISEDLSVNAYATMFHLLDPSENSPDGHYGILGLDVSYRLTESTSVSVGYGTTVADNDRDEQRMNLGLIMEF